MKLIDKDAALAMIEELESQNNCGTDDFIESKRIAYKQVKDGVLEMQEIVSMQEEPVCEDLEAEIEKYMDKHLVGNSSHRKDYEIWGGGIARHFAEWQKEQMMHGAEEAVVKHNPNDYGEYDPYVRVRVSRGFKEGSKVKVLIIKED